MQEWNSWIDAKTNPQLKPFQQRIETMPVETSPAPTPNIVPDNNKPSPTYDLRAILDKQ
jgi:hypothetical protein